MATRNDITGDSIQSKGISEDYRSGWDKIFGKGKDTLVVDSDSVVIGLTDDISIIEPYNPINNLRDIEEKIVEAMSVNQKPQVDIDEIKALFDKLINSVMKEIENESR